MRPTPSIEASRTRSSCELISTCSLLPFIANRDRAPRDTSDSNTNCPPWCCAALATRTQVLTMALARTTGAGKPPSRCGTPIGCRSVRNT
eukprot:6191116-Pleurochrysis_carterae.AAC.1